MNPIGSKDKLQTMNHVPMMLNTVCTNQSKYVTRITNENYLPATFCIGWVAYFEIPLINTLLSIGVIHVKTETLMPVNEEFLLLFYLSDLISIGGSHGIEWNEGDKNAIFISSSLLRLNNEHSSSSFFDCDLHLRHSVCKCVWFCSK